MIFLKKDNYSNEDIEIIENEKQFLITNSKIQRKNKEIILNYIQKFATSNNLIDVNSVNHVLDFLEDLKHCLQLCNENISNFDKCIHNLDAILFYIRNNDQLVRNAFNTYNSEYLELYKTILENTLNVEESLCNLSQKFELSFAESADINVLEFSEVEPQNEDIMDTTTTIAETEVEEMTNSSDVQLQNIEVENVTEEPVVNEQVTNIDEEKPKDEELFNYLDDIIPDSYPKREYQENTLIVSETSGKVTLPYDVSEIKKLIKYNPREYPTVDSVIRRKYTLPISNFKNQFVARFKEAFKLVRKRENGSIADALELGLELMFNSSLHPAIIAACKTMDELDIYLDYLKSGETNKFGCFKVIFEAPPLISKQRKNPVV